MMIFFPRRSEEVARGRGCTHTYAIVTGKSHRDNDDIDDDEYNFCT